MKDNMKYIGILFITLFFSVFFANAQVWTPPTQIPPLGNPSPPLHEGGTAQSKIGGLLIATGSVTNGLIVQNGNVGIGVLSPTQKVDVDGYVKGTGLCIGSDCKTAWPATPPTPETDTLASCGVSLWDINSTYSGWSPYKYVLCQGYLPSQSAGTDATLGVPRGCPSGYSALYKVDSQGAPMYTCINTSGWSTYPGAHGVPRVLFGPF